MALARTEASHPLALGLDQRPATEAARILAQAQAEAARIVEQAAPAIAEAAGIVAATLERGGRVFYAAAGSSGLMALADALEMPGTFGVAVDRIVVLIAGGQAAFVDLAGAPEDDGESVAAELAAKGLSDTDCLIALSASGTTAYAITALDAARQCNAKTIGIANNAGTPLLNRADVGICLPTPPEVISGSTRMGAGTAQKIALNILSTLAASQLGHVHDGLMVNLRVDNAKLRDRAARIVTAITGCDSGTASEALRMSDGAVKPAVLIAAGAHDLASAQAILADTNGRLRPALAFLSHGSSRPAQSRS